MTREDKRARSRVVELLKVLLPGMVVGSYGEEVDRVLTTFITRHLTNQSDRSANRKLPTSGKN